MKRVLIISFLIFIILICISNNIIFATNPNEAEISNAILGAAQNAANAWNEAQKNEQALLNQYQSFLNSFNSNNSNTTSLPQTGSPIIMPLLLLLSISSTIFLILKIKRYKDIV